LTTPFTAYRAPKWLPGGHAQTIYPLLIKAAPPPYRRERWETPDSDFIDLDWMDAPTDASDTQALPLLILFHGLEGSSSSHYATSLMAATKARGWTGVVSHFRGCSGESNRLPRAYHSGDSDEIDWVLRRLRQRHPERPIYVTGVSLGGNALLKWLGEREFLANDVINAAASVCAPLDLAICGHHLGRGFNKVYTQHFLQTLKKGAAEKLVRFPGIFDGKRMQGARNLYEFDDVRYPMPEIFKAYDIRGIVDTVHCPHQGLRHAVRAIGHALGSLARRAGQAAIAVGRDGRLSGPALAGALPTASAPPVSTSSTSAACRPRSPTSPPTSSAATPASRSPAATTRPTTTA
jgi:hypothetical protein